MEISISVTDNDKDAPIWRLEDDLNGEATVLDFKTFHQRALWQIGEEVLKDEQAKGFDKKPRVRTDNKWGKDPRDVKVFGKIEYFSRQGIGEALLEAYSMVEKKSPIVTGQYQASHYVYLNAKKIADSRGELYVWLKEKEGLLQDNDLIRIVNVTPYAARVEMRGGRRGTKGKNSSKRRAKMINGLSITQSNGAYTLAARSINAKYKAQGNVKFSMLPNGFGGVSVQPTGRFRTTYISDSGRRNKRKRHSGPYVYPSITFRIAGEGIQ